MRILPKPSKFVQNRGMTLRAVYIIQNCLIIPSARFQKGKKCESGAGNQVKRKQIWVVAGNSFFREGPKKGPRMIESLLQLQQVNLRCAPLFTAQDRTCVLSLLLMLWETLLAIHGSVLGRLEGNFAVFSAIRTFCFEHFLGSEVSCRPSISAMLILHHWFKSFPEKVIIVPERGTS